MTTVFNESKVSIILVAVMSIMALALGLLGFCYYSPMVGAVLVIPVLLLLLCFYSLRVTVADGYLSIVYGCGLFARDIPLEEIRSYEVVPNSYLTWIYKPSLSHVLRMQLRDGGTCVAGIGDARRLMNIISGIVRG